MKKQTLKDKIMEVLVETFGKWSIFEKSTNGDGKKIKFKCFPCPKCGKETKLIVIHSRSGPTETKCVCKNPKCPLCYNSLKDDPKEV